MKAFMSSRAIGHAQEATLIGVMTDTTGGVLPGVTIKAACR
jgi:hypothetical protein